MALNGDHLIRNAQPADYAHILEVADLWWGRPISHILHPNYIVHFGNTCFVAEHNGKLTGFLLGFVSQAQPGWAHIHAVSVSPEYRGHGLARALYERFFKVVRGLGCRFVSSMTSPQNKDSIAFHRAMGFSLVEKDTIEVDGVPAVKDYAGPGQHRVLFERKL